MTVKALMTELESMGTKSIRKIYLKHGIKEPMFGVKVEQLKATGGSHNLIARSIGPMAGMPAEQTSGNTYYFIRSSGGIRQKSIGRNTVFSLLS
jgi:hypothetical protein